MKVKIDGVYYYPKTVEQQEVNVLLNQLYSIIWTEAYYDPDSADSEKFAKKLLPAIAELNEILKFKD